MRRRRKKTASDTNRRLILPIAVVVLVVGLILPQYLKNRKDAVVVDIFSELFEESPKKKTEENPVLDLPTQTKPVSASLFVPYWTVSRFNTPTLPPEIQHGDNRYLMYFGITPSTTGIDANDPGYKNLSLFEQKTTQFDGKKLLTLRMIDEDVNRIVLENPDIQSEVINKSLSLAIEHGFDGIVLDLEHSVIPTQGVIDSITGFIQTYSSAAHSQNQLFTIALFGDTFYRQRPYDVAAISEVSDHIFIMTYDFHKSFGEPGPNFPLQKGSQYDYDLVALVEELILIVPKEKLTFLFGVFGYDWSVDEENRPASSAKPLTYNQILNKFDGCPFTDCHKNRDDTSGETNITYIDDVGQNHSVWYEDVDSIQNKIGLLQSHGINSIGYWAFGYY